MSDGGGGGAGDGDGEDHGGFCPDSPDTNYPALSSHLHRYPNLASSYPTHAHLQKYAPSHRFSSHQHDHQDHQQHDHQHDHHDHHQDYFSKQGYPLQDGYHHNTTATSVTSTQRQSTNISQKDYPSQKGFPTYIPEHQDTTYLPDDYGSDGSVQYKKMVDNDDGEEDDDYHDDETAPDESVIVRAGQYERCPDNYLCLAIFVTCFCCLPFGICGVIHASQVKSLWEEGEIHDAKAASRLARRWSIAGLIFGALIIVSTVTGFAVKYMWNKWKIDFGEDGEYDAE